MKSLSIFNYKAVVILIALPIIFSVSCTDLQENTSGALSPDNFYKTKDDLQSAVIPMYKYFSGAFKNAQGQICMYGGDDITTRPGANKAQFRAWDRFEYNANSGWMRQFAYKPYWKTIHAANVLLANIKEAPSSLSQDFLDKVAGQAHFMRGLSYYMLVRQFGGMPLITSANPTGNKTRASVLKNYQLIEEDMQFAASHLPKSWSSGTKGRATSGAARTVLSSLYLTWAGWPVKDESKYAMAASEAQKVMQSGTYALMSDFVDLWKTENDNNKEVIFSIIWNLDANTFSNTIAQGYAPIEEKGWVDGYAEIALFKRMPPGPRKDATYLTTFTKSNGDTVNWKNSQLKHPTFQKWTMGGRPRGGTPHRLSGKNVPLFRYAQVLLIFAEAETMANGGPTAQAYNAINKVRERAGLSDLPAGMSQSEFREAVIAERSYEFAGEYTRWFDMVRTEIVEEVAKMRSPQDLELAQQPTKAQYISPIPSIEIQRTNMKQNPEGNKIK